jgi:hypothetical protein
VDGKPVKYVLVNAFSELPNLRAVRFLSEDIHLLDGAFADCPLLDRVLTLDRDPGFDSFYKNCPGMFWSDIIRGEAALTEYVYGKPNQFEGLWEVYPEHSFFYSKILYTFNGHTWTLQKLKGDKVVETQEGTFSHTWNRIVMLVSRFKSTGDWQDGGGMSIDGNYVMTGDTLSLGGVKLRRVYQLAEEAAPLQPDLIGGLYYSMALPEGWGRATDNLYLSQLLRQFSVFVNGDDSIYQAWEDQNNKANLLLIVERAVPYGYVTTTALGSPQHKKYNGKEYLVSESEYPDFVLTIAVVVHKNVSHTFFFVLNNDDTRLVDQCLETVVFR